MKLFQRLINLVKLLLLMLIVLVLHGKTIQMTSDNIAIQSEGVTISSTGNSVFKGAGQSNTNLQVEDMDNTNYKTRIYPQAITISGKSGVTRLLSMGGCRLDMTPTINSSGISITAYNDGELERTVMRLFNETSETTITPTGITTPTVTQTSLESEKKNFNKLENALDILKDIDIYKYNLKAEEDDTKKHIGFVIGDKFKYSEEVTSNNNDGVDIYSFVSVCCKAIQEQQQEIQELKARIEKLEKGDK